ncbi:MAG: alcohol dehydrogenase catalytic domain-containing protein, partial [Gemmataceae bacterium]
MKAVVFEKFGEPAEVLQVRDIPKPEVGPGLVRVKMVASPINPSDLLTVRGVYGKLPALPATPGFEGAGIVDEAGPGLLKLVRRL